MFFAIGGQWYPLLYRDLYDIWFLGIYWLTGIARRDFVTLVVGSQEPSSECIKMCRIMLKLYCTFNTVYMITGYKKPYSRILSWA